MATNKILAIENFISNSVAVIVAYPNPITNSFTIDTKTNTDDFIFSFYDFNRKYNLPKYLKTDTKLFKINI